MLKTWEKTCCRASIIVPNLDFSRWTGPSGRLLRAGDALRAGWPASEHAPAASGGGKVGGSGRRGEALPLPVLVERQRVDHDGVTEQVQMLAGMPDAVGP